jgi:glycosyltransferase involved in cell wall biosynthesis
MKPPEKKHLIYIGYLVPRKNVGKLIEIIERLSEKRDDFVLDILGDGSEKRMLEKMVEEKGLKDVVLFHGFVQKIDLPEYFAQGTCFLFQTDFDIWGLVLNEAMAAGVPVISSVTAGATYDLISEGETGFAADYNNLSDVLLKINMILDHPELVERIRKKAGDAIEEKASLGKSAKGFVDSVILE